MKKEKQFIYNILALRDYWLKEERAITTKDKLDGFIFSLLAMLDGESGLNDFHYIKLYDAQTKKYINDGNIFLHETLCAIERELLNKKDKNS